jgi:tetratricopeptide (TPR) repeat protein
VGEAAFGLAEALGDRERAVRSCQLVQMAADRYGSGRTRRIPVFRSWAERLDRYAAPGTLARVEADIRLAAIRSQGNRWSERRQLEARALAGARELGDPEALFLVASRLIGASWGPGRWRELVDLAIEVAARPREGISRHVLAEFLTYGVGFLDAAGERERADALQTEREELMARAHDGAARLVAQAYVGRRDFLDGEFDAVLISAERVLALGDEIGSPVLGRINAWSLAFWPLIWQGRLDEVTTLRDRVYEVALPTHLDLGVPSLLLSHQGALDDARAQLHDAMQQGEISPEGPTRPLANMLETAVLVEDREAVEVLAPPLRGVPAASLQVTAVARHLGRAARLLGDPDSARDRYTEALAWATKLRFRPEIALTRLDMAEMFLEGPAEQRAEALSHLDFAIEEFRAMKMQPALERALRHKGLLKA